MEQNNNSQLSGREDIVQSFTQLIAGLTPEQLTLWKKMFDLLTQQATQLKVDQSDPKELKQEAGNAPKHTQEDETEQVVLPSRKTRWVNRISPEESKRKYEEQKTIAEHFIKYGINYHKITFVYPEMLPKTYRCYVEAINNQTVNEIVEYLRYECNMEIERLNRDQKRSIRTQLTKIRDWMGNTNKQQLELFYTFIRRHYDRNKAKINPQDALALYKTILCIIKSPYVNVLADNALQEAQQKERPIQVAGNLSENEAKAAIMLYIKWKDLTKVTDQMCQKYGYDVKFSYHSIKNSLKQLLEASVEKLLKNFKRAEMEIYGNCFTPKNMALLHQTEDTKMKIDLYSYYLQEKTSYVKVKNLAQKLADFFQKNAPEPSITLPKVEATKSEEISEFQITKSHTIKAEAEPETQSEDSFNQDEEVKVEAEIETKNQ